MSGILVKGISDEINVMQEVEVPTLSDEWVAENIPEGNGILV